MDNRLAVAIITGTTASGKTAVALEFARSKSNGLIEIINADSLLLFRGMNIGTAKPNVAELNEVRHHLVDLLDPDQAYTAGDYFREASAAIEEIHARGKRALVVGGSGFYIKALVFGLWAAPAAAPDLRMELRGLDSSELHARLCGIDPKHAARISPNDRYRITRALEVWRSTGKPPSIHEQEALDNSKAQSGLRPGFGLFFLDRPREELRKRIEERTRQMLRAGLLAEARALSTLYPDSRPLMAVGYRESIRYLGQSLAPPGRKLRPGEDGLCDEISLATVQLVKRQRTWFNGQFAGMNRVWSLELDRDRAKLFEDLEKFYA
ncbi:MAG: tRNA (adenosine(37)-N6)-dimethylallyltransferase MiaA [Bdellovibrionota bacterium]